jgi:hypothetical protein
MSNDEGRLRQNQSSNSQGFPRAFKAKLHRGRVRAVDQRRRRREQATAVQRWQIPGVERMRAALEEVEYAQQKLREAGDSVQALLSIAPLATVFTEFQEQGGITSADWTKWLNGGALSGCRYNRKQHLRLVSTRTRPSIPRRQIASRQITHCNNGDDPEAA